MIDFAKVEKSVRELKTHFIKGQIDQKTFEDRLLEMIDVADDGNYWMFGHESERWFRYDGKKWVPDNPNEVLASVTQDHLFDKKGAPSDRAVMEQDVGSEWRTLNLGWFIASLTVIAAIGGIVYYSTLV